MNNFQYISYLCHCFLKIHRFKKIQKMRRIAACFPDGVREWRGYDVSLVAKKLAVQYAQPASLSFLWCGILR